MTEGESPVRDEQHRDEPHAWVGQEVHVVYVGAGIRETLNCTLRKVSNLGIAVVAGERSSFFPWSSVIRLDLGHVAAHPTSRMRVRR